MANDYQPDQILRVAVPQWAPAADGTWTREWEIRLAERPRFEELPNLSDDCMEVAARLEGDHRTLRVVTRTKSNPHSDEMFYAAAYRMLRRIDAEIGHIELVQGQPREWWQPFRERK